MPLFPKTNFWHPYTDENINVIFSKEHDRGSDHYNVLRNTTLPLLRTRHFTCFEDVWFYQAPISVGRCLNPFWTDLANPEECFDTHPAPKEGDHFDLLYVLGSGEHDTSDPYRFLVFKGKQCWLFRYMTSVRKPFLIAPQYQNIQPYTNDLLRFQR